MKAAALAVAMLAAAPTGAPAGAQEHPLTTPTRDVDVTYRAGSGPQPVEQRSRYRAADQKVRLDTPTPGVYMIVDQRARSIAMVSDADHGVVEMPLRGAAGPAGVAPGQDFARRGVDQVVGLACTEWETVDSLGQPTAACFTADGVLLRARRGAQVFVIASRVTYGPLDPQLFTVPAGYARTTARAGR